MIVSIIVRTTYPCFTHVFFKMKTNNLFITIVKCSVYPMSTFSDALSLPHYLDWNPEVFTIPPSLRSFSHRVCLLLLSKYIFPLSLLFCNLSCDQMTDWTHNRNILIKFSKWLSNSRLYTICLLLLLKGTSPIELPFTISFSCSDRNLGVISAHFLRVG